MKRTLLFVAGAAALTCGIYLVSRLNAQQPAGQPAAPQAAPEPRTRIALINLAYVIKNYEKFKSFQGDMKKTLEVYQARDKEKASQLEAIVKKAGEPTTSAAEKEQLEKQGKDLQRAREDNSNDAKMLLGKKSDEQMVILYKEVQDAAQRYAAAHNFELVLHYNDATTATEYWSPQNVMRKMQAGACMPLYAVPGMDISAQVVATLNASYTTAAPAGGNPVPR